MSVSASERVRVLALVKGSESWYENVSVGWSECSLADYIVLWLRTLHQGGGHVVPQTDEELEMKHGFEEETVPGKNETWREKRR